MNQSSVATNRYGFSFLMNSGYLPELDRSGKFIINCLPTGETFRYQTTRRYRDRFKEIRKEIRNCNNQRISQRLRFLWSIYGDSAFEFEIML
ncbi:MAG: hypothetical protein AAF298_09095 [Cyanobacteria bacterium P01_A01_bin.40]